VGGVLIVTIKSDRTRAIDQAVTQAHRRADDTGLVYAVVELDHEDGRAIRVVLLSSTWDDEFEAFCGEVLYVTEEGDDHE